MTTKPTKIMAEQQREVPLLQRRANPDDGSFSWLTVLGFAFLTFNSTMAIYRSDGDVYAVAFVSFSYVDLVLLFYSLRQFEKAGANSPAREKLKVAVWVLTTLLTGRVHEYVLPAVCAAASGGFGLGQKLVLLAK